MNPPDGLGTPARARHATRSPTDDWADTKSRVLAAALEGIPSRAVITELVQGLSVATDGAGALVEVSAGLRGLPDFGAVAAIPARALSNADGSGSTHTPAARAAESEEPIRWSGDPSEWGEGGPALLEAGVDRSLSTRVVGRTGRVFGTVTVFWSSDVHGEEPAWLPIAREAKDLVRVLVENESRQILLRRSEERLSLALASSREGVYDWYVAEDHLLVDHRWCSIVGIRPADLTGTSSDWVDFLHPEDSESIQALLQSVLDGDTQELRSRYRVLRTDGETRWVEVRGRVVLRGPAGAPLRMAGTYLDVTEEKARESEIERLRAAIANLNDVVLITTPARSVEDPPLIQFVSGGVERVLGIAPDELIGRTTEELFGRSEGDVRVLLEARVRLMAGESVRTMFELDSTSRGRISVEVVTQPIHDADPEKCFWVSVARDVTERLRAESELAESREQLRHAQKMEAVGRLAGGMAHDFNNLLTAILGYGEFIQDEAAPDSELRRDAEEIVRAATRGQAITRQLLAFSRKSGWNAEVLRTADVVAGIDRLIDRLVGEDVATELHPGVSSGFVEADLHQLEQAVVNLVINARDALVRGGRVVIRTGQLDLVNPMEAHPEAIPVGAWEVISVEDDGHGVPAELLHHIFEPFFTTKAAGKGTGLGLATVYGTVKQCGGYVTVESPPDGGARFQIVLPRREATGEAAARPVDETRGELPGGDETILVVEDETQVRNFTTRMLERFGYTVVQARHGRDGLLMWERHGGRIDLVLSDVVMPEMDGPELARQLRSRDADVRILFMSGYTGGTTGSRVQADPIPTKDLIAKPFATPELLTRVRERLDRAD